ncbi:hypothetical protein NSQ43_11330 [Sporosarcina sp. FSL W8-0480]|uniref:hypothetical protein n=1 Tax=Sporosarcina sp. FSL W8-0480 TaxID=2954701 RepID=UPI0030DBF60D
MKGMSKVLSVLLIATLVILLVVMSNQQNNMSLKVKNLENQNDELLIQINSLKEENEELNSNLKYFGDIYEMTLYDKYIHVSEKESALSLWFKAKSEDINSIFMVLSAG